MDHTPQSPRRADDLVESSARGLGSKLKLIATKQVRLWKALLAVMFVAGFASALTWAVSESTLRGEQEGIEFSESEAAGVKLGDVNGDGKVTGSDALLVYQYVAGKTTLTSSQLLAADVTQNKWVTQKDGDTISAFLAFVVTRFTKFGDVTFDNKITGSDSLLVAQFVSGAKTPDANQTYYGDVNGDKAITSADVDLINQFLAFVIFAFPVDPTPPPTSSLPDYLIETLKVTAKASGQYCKGKSHAVSFTVKNQGGAASVSSRTRVFDQNSAAVCNVTVPALAGGAVSQFFTCSWIPAATGTSTITADTDRDNTIAESNEKNNFKTFTANVVTCN